MAEEKETIKGSALPEEQQQQTVETVATTEPPTPQLTPDVDKEASPAAQKVTRTSADSAKSIPGQSQKKKKEKTVATRRSNNSENTKPTRTPKDPSSEKPDEERSASQEISTPFLEKVFSQDELSISEQSKSSEAEAGPPGANKPRKRRDVKAMDAEKLKESDDSVSESGSGKSVDSETSYLKQKELEVKPDFFEVLGEIPSLTEISLDISEAEEAVEAPRPSQEVVTDDRGQFVDPLTGEEEPAPEEPPPPPPPPETQHEPVEEQEDQEGEEDSQEEDLLLPAEIEDEVPAEKYDDDGLNLWYTIEPPKAVHMVEEIDFEAIERMENDRRNQEATLKFLEELITQIVDKCEYVDPNTILRQNLDKVKLMTELNLKLADLEVEQKARFFLNRKTVEYFRRKKAFRSILEDNPDTITQAIEKYKEATITLDQLLGREEETRNLTNFKIAELEGQVFDVQELSKASSQQFEELVRKTLRKDSFNMLPLVVDSLLKKIATHREEISKVRLVLIQRQHTFSKLLEKSSKLESIGDGLLMRDYEHLQTETLALSKKIEERNTELNKFRTRYNADLHIMSHLKEKQLMLRHSIGIQEAALRELIDEKQTCRENLYELKMDHSKIRRQIRDLSFQGGLIDKPALMLDYDETVARLEVMRVKVEQKRNKFSDIQQRIRAMEGDNKDNDEYNQNESEDM